MENLNIVAIIQARRGSTRLPDKIFMNLAKKPLIEHVVLRLKKSNYISKTIIATTVNKKDDLLENWAIDKGITVYRGSEENVLERYYNTAKEHFANIIVRITADDPFKDYRIIDEAIKLMIENNYDFVCNNNPPSFPEGLDVEIITMEALEKSFFNAKTNFEKEHVTQYIHKNKSKFKVFNLKNKVNLSHHRWTIDTKEDYLYAKEIYEKLYVENELFLPEEIYKLIENTPSLSKINKDVKRSDMYL